MSLLAIDMGSSSCKAVVFSVDGRALSYKTHVYKPESLHPGWAEMQPENFWNAFRSVTRAVAAEVADPVEVLAISSHGETFIPVDSQGRPVANAILNLDQRAIKQTRWLAENIGRKRTFQITGLPIHTMYPLPKILWLRDNQREVFESTSCFLALPTYLLARLGLPRHVDHSLASRFFTFDIHKQRWSDEILSKCGLDPKLFPTTVAAGTVAGELNSSVASDLGLLPKTKVVVGGHDQPCGALGCGVINAGRVSASLGTYECLVAASETPAVNDQALAANLNSYCHVVPNRFVNLVFFPAGVMLEWFVGLVHPERRTSAADLFAELEASVPPGPTGILVTPHLPGTCNPDFDSHASGVIAGIRPSTSASDLYKAILEGIAGEFAAMTELLQKAVGSLHDVYVTGGGTRSRLGLSLRASLANVSLHLMRSDEAVCLGTAMLAGVGAGKYRNFDEAVQQLVVTRETIDPAPGCAARYRQQLDQYRLLYSALAPIRKAQAMSSQGES